MTTLALAAVLMFGMSSCTKDYTCVCIDTSNGDELSRSTIDAKDSQEAEEACDNKESIWYSDRCTLQG